MAIETGSRRRAVLGLLSAATLAITGCLQEISVAPDRSTVTGDFAMEPGLTEGNIRVDLAGSAPTRVNNSRDLLITAAAFTDEEGRFKVTTPKEGGRFFLVARHVLLDPEIGPLGPLAIGRTTVLTGVFPVPEDELNDPPALVAPPRMLAKRPGRVKFIYLATENAFQNVATVQVLGDFNGFSKTEGLIELFDDGSTRTIDDDGNVSGDAFPSDRVFVRVIENVPPGNLRYNFLINANVVLRDPFEEGNEPMVDELNLPVIRSVVRVF